jgi:hypothetical protein
VNAASSVNMAEFSGDIHVRFTASNIMRRLSFLLLEALAVAPKEQFQLNKVKRYVNINYIQWSLGEEVLKNL